MRPWGPCPWLLLASEKGKRVGLSVLCEGREKNSAAAEIIFGRRRHFHLLHPESLEEHWTDEKHVGQPGTNQNQEASIIVVYHHHTHERTKC